MARAARKPRVSPRHDVAEQPCPSCGGAYATTVRSALSYRDAAHALWYRSGFQPGHGAIVGLMARSKREAWTLHLDTCRPLESIATGPGLSDADDSLCDPSAEDLSFAPVVELHAPQAPAAPYPPARPQSILIGLRRPARAPRGPLVTP